jgi:type IV fimbrial biogenesis protein FimT
MKQQRGFSIIELAVTLVVLGILITSAIPNITSWMRNTRLRNEAESLLAGLQQARNEAVRQNRPVTFSLVNLPTANSMNNQCAVSATGTSWVVSLSSPDGKCGVTDRTAAPQIVAARVGADGSGSVTVSGLQSDKSTASSSVQFDGFGRASGTAGIRLIQITFATVDPVNDRPMNIEISSSGLTRMCDTKAPSGDPRACTSGTFQ